MSGMDDLLAVAILYRRLGFRAALTAVDPTTIQCACGAAADAGTCGVAGFERFEGMSDPGDESILFAIVMPCGHRGLLWCAYGPTADETEEAVIKSLPTPNPPNPGLGHQAALHAADEEGGDPPCWAHLLDDAPDLRDTDLADLLRDLADGVIICDPEGRIVFWNDAATRIFGWEASEAVGASLDLIIPERLRDRHWRGYRTVMATGTTSYADRLLEVPALHRDAHTISIAFTVSLVRHEDGTPKAIAAVVRDDTARWQERRALRSEVARLHEAGPRAAGPSDSH